MLWAATFCWVVAVIGQTLSESLRAFSRSRLLNECRSRGHEERFREILAGDEDAVLLTSAVTLAAAAFGVLLSAAAFSGLFAESLEWTVGLGWGLGLLAVTVIGLTVIPNSLAQAFAEPFVDRSWPLLRMAIRGGAPILATSAVLRTILLRLADRESPENEAEYITEEIDAVVDEGERDGSLEQGVSQMIQRVIDLQNVDVRDVMTPRTEIVTLPIETPFAEARRCFTDAGHSRIPVIGESPDDLRGVVYAKDLLKAVDERVELTALLREPLIVPESTPVDRLLERMRQHRMHIAIVLDEYGGVVGLVTLEDILEEIVGDISDEYDAESEVEEIVEIDARTVEVEARAHVDDLNDRFDYELPEEGDYETIGGYVFSELGHVPTVGEKLVRQGLEFTVVEADLRKIVRLQIQRLDTANAAS